MPSWMKKYVAGTSHIKKSNLTENRQLVPSNSAMIPSKDTETISYRDNSVDLPFPG